MKLLAVCSLIVMMPWMMSCGKKENSTGLDVVVKPDTSFLLPGTSEGFCYQSDIAGPRLYYPRMTITWSGSGDFYPAVMKVTFKTAQVNYTCTLEDHVPFLFQEEITGAPVTADFLESGKTYVLKDLCAIECGGISATNPDQSFKVVGELKVIGYALDDDDNQIPATARSTIFLQNLN
jgi:hypothetical protein